MIPGAILAVPAVDFERPLNAILRRLATLTLARDQTALLGRFPKRLPAAFWRYAIDFDREWIRIPNQSAVKAAKLGCDPLLKFVRITIFKNVPCPFGIFVPQ